MAHNTAKFTINDDRKDRCAEIRSLAQQVQGAAFGYCQQKTDKNETSSVRDACMDKNSSSLFDGAMPRSCVRITQLRL